MKKLLIILLLPFFVNTTLAAGVDKISPGTFSSKASVSVATRNEASQIELSVEEEERISQEEYIELIKRFESLRQSYAAASMKVNEGAGTNMLTRFRSVENKAFKFDAQSTHIKFKDEMIENLKKDLKRAKYTIDVQDKRIAKLSVETNNLSKIVLKLEEEQAPLRNSLALLRLGKFEYYEIKEGDTCGSIAAKPSIYGDASKHAALRQANQGHIADLENLVPGEMMIVPRYSTMGDYDF